MSPRYGTIFEVLRTKAIRHRVREQDAHTACNKELFFSGPKGSKLFNAYHDLSCETRCKKCYPDYKKGAKPWRTSSKKKSTPTRT